MSPLICVHVSIVFAVQYTGVPIAHLAAASVKILSCKAGEGEQLGKDKRAECNKGDEHECTCDSV